MANQHYTLWVKSGCPFCVKAQQELLENIKSHTDILRVIDEGFKKVGDFVTLTIWRDGNVIELPLELADRK